MLKVQDLSKRYETPGGNVEILRDVSFALQSGESAAIMGPSGCGKSTLLNSLGALDQPTSGTIELDGVNPYRLPDTEQAQFRNALIGFVFQDHCLLPQLTALENVLTPLLVGPPDADAEARAGQLLDLVGLASRRDHRPGQLSGGEKQRVAIARALVRRPKLLLCDEPTGNLDPHAADLVAGLLQSLQSEQKMVMIVVTHSAEIASRFQRIWRIEDGRLCVSAS